MIAGICHRDVVKQVLECADDLVVEGFFREYGKKVEENGGGGERIEACVFSSESLRQIIVCFRGSTAAQARPVKSNLFGREGETSYVRIFSYMNILLFILTLIIFLFITHFATHDHTQHPLSWMKNKRCPSSPHSSQPTLVHL